MRLFVLHLEKEKRYDIETFSIDVVLNKEHFKKNFFKKKIIGRLSEQIK